MSESLGEKRSEYAMPWAPPASWQAANRSVDYHLQRYRSDLKQLAMVAREIKSDLNSIFPILDELCAQSCPWCPEPCCLKASIWFDFKDLLFLHFNSLPISPTQPKANLKTPCGYLGPSGCQLSRIVRPWVCTWYVCPTQKAKLRNRNQGKDVLLNRAFAQIKIGRNLLESEYIRIIS